MLDVLHYARECIRVLNVASRPRKREFEKIVKITLLGIILIGLIGVLISFILSLTEIRI
ncbi:MAG: protein translocase SEC61 complex subunit gamma [Candidatus Micrarchaeota archaeon]|nr:protein translocase SEC61 complex subunit gamma [Candidatus Micrarchaeota archaeon]